MVPGNGDLQFPYGSEGKENLHFQSLADFLINGYKYRAWAYNGLFERQTSILARWDSLNTHRKIVGFSAVDEHENVNFRARYTGDGSVQWMGINTKTGRHHERGLVEQMVIQQA